MPRTRTQESEGSDFIQFRGRQTSVTVDAVGVHFGTERRNGRIAHEAIPVVSDDVDPRQDDVPSNAVVESVAEALTESNHLIAYGVACEHPDCDAVFDTPQAVSSHQSAHADDDTADGGDGGD
jgi:hypothetical protein